MRQGSSRLLVSRRALLAVSAAVLARPAAADAVGAVAVFGDSQAEGVVAGLRRVARKRPDAGLVLINRTKPGTAISQPSYDWQATIADYAAPANQAGRAPIAVCMFGGNDRLPMRPATGPAIQFHTAAWEAVYRERLDAMMTALAKAGIHVLWLGQPVCKEPRYSADMAWLNGLFQESAAKVTAANPEAPPVRFLPLWTVIADEKGGFIAYGPGPDGKPERLRHDDGIHFSASGYEIVARAVLAALA